MKKKSLEKIVKDFIEEQEITCPECIYQTDGVIENAYEFIEKLCDVVGYHEEEDEEDL